VLFVQSALVPVRRAAAHLGASRVSDGLLAIAPGELRGGLRAGMERTARSIGATAGEVERALPMSSFESVLERVKVTYEAAILMWSQQSSRVGGLTGFSGGTAVTDVRKDSAAGLLKNLAGRFVRDKHLYKPLHALATDILEWEELIDQCGALLDRSELAAMYRARKLRRALLLSAGALVVLGAAGAGVTMKFTVLASRERVESAIAAPDPCAVESIVASDSKRATQDQLRRVDARRQQCEGARAVARYEASCDTLASHLESGQLTAEDEALSQASAPLMGRIARSALAADDLMIAANAMPCQDSKSAERFWTAYARAAGRSQPVWAETEKVSEKLRGLLKAPGAGLSDGSAQAIIDRAEAAAGKAILDGRAESMERAVTLCDFQVSLGVDRGPKCKGVIVVAERLRR
jgi:hypothetical protein